MFSSNTSQTSSDVNYIEDVFSTYLYTGTGAAQTITNNIDLSGKGGLTWIKARSAAATMNVLFDTVRGATNNLYSNSTSAQVNEVGQAFTSSGFTVSNFGETNASGQTQASWTFREQPKFFDVVTYTGTGSNTTIAHNLGSVPGFIIVKRTDTTGAWQCYHRSLANTQYMVLNTTAAVATGATRWNSTTPTSTVFSLGTDATVNASGGTYVAYIFAHDAGGFGLTGTDNVISCGSLTTNGSGNATVNLGYEPQWVLVKQSATISAGYGDWYLLDNMRGWTTDGGTNLTNLSLNANLSSAEFAAGFPLNLNSTGFTFQTTDPNWQSKSFIYIAIRRGPMKVPTSGTSVFAPDLGSSSGTLTYDSNFVVDFAIDKSRTASPSSARAVDRLRGAFQLLTPTTDAESSSTVLWDSNTTLRFNSSGDFSTRIGWMFRRAPSFFDVVCYTGTGSSTTITHNLTVAPELLFVKSRSNVQNWSALCTLNSGLQGRLNTTDALSAPSAAVFGNGTSYVAPTASVFTVGTDNETNASTWTYCAYLFSTCAGVSKVGSYTGTGTTLQINCGFTAGARFVLIKRTSSTGDWYVWDTARGIIAGNDPYLLLNSTAAEVTSTDYIDTYSAGFEISSTAPAAINASGGTFIFLAIA